MKEGESGLVSAEQSYLLESESEEMAAAKFVTDPVLYFIGVR